MSNNIHIFNYTTNSTNNINNLKQVTQVQPTISYTDSTHYRK